MKMPNVVVLDSQLNIFKKIKAWADIKIYLLIVENKEQKMKVKKEEKAINVYTFQEILNWDKSFVSRRQIKKYRDLQLKVERYNNRINTLSSYNISCYYSALAFYLNFLNSNIDSAFIDRMNHGSAVDYLLIELLKEKKVPVFGPESVFRNSVFRIFAIRCYNTDRCIDISKIDHSLCMTKETLAGMLDYEPSFEEQKQIQKSEKMFRTQWHKHVLEEILTYKSKASDKSGLTYILPFRQIQHSYFHLRKLKKYLKRVETEIEESDAKAVFYALHYEPEASFMNRVDYDSQIYNIKMISSALPEGWTLYVKEHPHQLNLFTRTKFSALKCIDKYRDLYFYKEILKNHNVKLIKCSISSKEIMRAPWVRGIISINGTIGLEAILLNKPAILLDGESAIYGQVSQISKVYDFKDIENEIRRMEDSKMMDYKDDMDIIANHVYSKRLLNCNAWDIPESILQETLCYYGKYVE